MNVLRQATASQTRTLGPFVDSTDGATLETGLTIANTDIKIQIDGGSSSNKNSGGGTHVVNGLYSVTFDATDTATVGEFTVSVAIAGALVVVHKFRVLEEAVFDAMFAASALGYVANAPVNMSQISGDATAADNAEAFFDGTGYAGTNNVIPLVTTATNLTNAPTSGDLTATMKASVTTAATAATPIAASVSGAVGSVTGSVGSVSSYGSLVSDIAIAVWSAGSRTLTAISDSSGITTLLSRIIGTIASGTHNAQSGDSFARLGSPSGASVSADIAAISVGSGGLDAAGVRAAIGLASANLDTQLDAIPTVGEIQSGLATAANLATVAGYLDTEIAAILAVMNKIDTALESDGAAGYQFTILALENAPSGSGASASAIADAVCDEALSGHATAGTVGAGLSTIISQTTAAAIKAAARTGVEGTWEDEEGNTFVLTITG